MDRELYSQSSALKETFEWVPKQQSIHNHNKHRNDGGIYNGRSTSSHDEDDDDDDDDQEIDIDMSVLKNLMEAQSQQQLFGSPINGPLGNILSQLGLKFPLPPPTSSSSSSAK